MTLSADCAVTGVKDICRKTNHIWYNKIIFLCYRYLLLFHIIFILASI